MEEKVTTHVSEETCNRRIENYVEHIADKPKNKTQLLAKGGKVILVIGGTPYECITAEGYVKLPDEDKFHIINQMDISVFILPKGKIIISSQNQREFLGFKKENSQGCCLLVHVITEYDDFLIISLDSNLPVFISADMVDEDEMNINGLVFMNMEYLFKKLYVSLVPTIAFDEGEGEDDEWE